MTHTVKRNKPKSPNCEKPIRLHSAPAECPTIALVLDQIQALVPPLWSLSDYVAVNPFQGWSGQSFLSARQELCSVRDCELLMPGEYYRRLFTEGRITWADVEQAYQQAAAENIVHYQQLSLDELRDWLESGTSLPSERERKFRTVAEIADHFQGGGWASHIATDITRHCAAYYDQGQAVWKSPWRDHTLYEAWQAAAAVSRRLDQLGITGFRRFVAQLPDTPRAALAELLALFPVAGQYWRPFLLTQLSSVAGWASYVKQRDAAAKHQGCPREDLLGLLAIRLAYDVALAQVAQVRWQDGLGPELHATDHSEPTWAAPDVLARYVMQEAVETAYRKRLCGMLRTTASPSRPTRPEVQMVFCIDVRSEVMRRHLEGVSDAVETLGFAGFFGLPFEYLPLGASRGSAQCPVLLQPKFVVREGCGPDSQARDDAISRCRNVRLWRRLWKSFQVSAASCFSFVESLGWLYGIKMLTDSLRLTPREASAANDGLPRRLRSLRGPDLSLSGSDAFTHRQKVDLAEQILRNLSLVQDWAPLVVLCGHTADVVNNPYRAALDCGACGGHSGEPNARVAAAILNDVAVRQDLAERGMALPPGTWFLSAVHHTTTDVIRFLDTDAIPASHRERWRRLQVWTEQAGELSRAERVQRMGNVPADDMRRRSRDWAEVRPEWGLAGNAAFIAAPRTRTAGLNLEWRTFMHSYDHRLDPHGKVLELILTAPLVVANWINLQYYASTVDNRAFGSGNKVMHNVVGLMGVLQGNGGDLMTGLPWQSVHDGRQLQHEPLRLLAVVEAPREKVRQILDKHSAVRALGSNGWLSLVVLEAGRFYRWTLSDRWIEIDVP